MRQTLRLVPVLLLLAPTLTAHASPASALSVSHTAHGVRFTLNVPRRVYPHAALARVTVRIKNVSQETIWEAPMMVGYCGRQAAVVNDLNSAGQPVDPLPPFSGPYPPCPMQPPAPLPPGGAITETEYVVLLAGRLQAITNVNTLSGTPNYSGSDLKTPVVTVALTPSHSPKVRLSLSGTTISATLSRPRGAKGPLRYEAWSSCAHVLSWAVAQGNTVTGCASSRQDWHMVAGWVNQPVAIIS